jgi:hypothetical protein
MTVETLFEKTAELCRTQQPVDWPALPESIPHGDMPGDKVEIGEEHIRKAKTILPALLPMLKDVMDASPSHRAVITVCGGSGVGKSEIASLLSFYLTALGAKSYTLSGDNYPLRYPAANDAERLRVYRYGGMRGLVASGAADAHTFPALLKLQKDSIDADPKQAEQNPWLQAYQQEGTRALQGYLGTALEQDYDLLSSITASFHRGDDVIWLKRMGRTAEDLWFEPVDFHDISVLVIEWTHGSSDLYSGVDIPILLNSTPAETAAHRRLRNRDGNIDSAFTTLVLTLEQQLLSTEAHKAKIIVSKQGDLLTYAQYEASMRKED